MIKKLLIALLISLVLLPSIIRPAFAQSGEWYDQSYQEWATKVYDENASPPSEIFGERYTAAQVQWVIYALMYNMKLGINSEMSLCFMNQDANACARGVSDLIATSNTPSGHHYAQEQEKESLIARIFAERPLSGIGYVREKLTKFHIVPEAKAQGFGFGALSPVRAIWVGARNITYALFVLVVIFFAFAVMLRLKIFSPQAVVTIQSAIPRVVIALILVTFSYAIAGFMVDLVYVVIGVLSMLFEVGGWGNASLAYNFMVGDNPVGLCNTFSGPPFCWHVGGVIPYLLLYIFLFSIALYASLFAYIPTLLSIVLASFHIYTLIAIIASLILIIVFLVAAFKILWMLFKAITMIYLLVIFGPLQIAFGSVAREGGFGSWVKNLAANLAVFPLTGILFYISFIFLLWSVWAAVTNVISGIPHIGGDLQILLDTVLAPLFESIFGVDLVGVGTGGWTPPFLGSASGGTALIFLISSLVILLQIPKIADIIKSVIAGQPFGYGAAIGEAFGPVKSAGRTGGFYAASRGAEYLERTGQPGSRRVAAAEVIRRVTGVK